MDNMEIWKSLENTADEAKKTIEAGRLKGFTDINPCWRMKRLTEVFGPCGIGWKFDILKTYTIPGANDEIAAFVDILLYYKHDGEWSEGIPGFGGSMFVAKESRGLHTSDECFKMALSDAIGTACKALGMSADIYFSKDRSKYTDTPDAADVKMETVEDAAGYKLTFGKHSGKTLGELFKTEKDYVEWLYYNDNTDSVIKKGISILLDAVRNSRK